MSVTTHWLNPMRLSILVYLPRIQKIAVKEMNDLEKYCKKGRLVRCEFSPEWFLSRPLWHGTITYEGLSQIDIWIWINVRGPSKISCIEGLQD